MADTDNNQKILQEEYLKNLENLQEGTLIEGTVISVTSDVVNIGIGYKSDGIIPLSEFEQKPKVGDTVKVVLVKKESRNGSVELSKEKADAISFKTNLESALANKTSVKGKIVKVIKGGYDVDLGFGFSAFLPISKADIARIEVPEELLGLEAEFYLEKLILDKKNNIVVNRRDLLVETTNKKRDAFFENAKEGDIVEGTVKTFTSFGSFVDLGGFDGLLHINDMGWGHVTRPKDFVKKGDKIKLKIIKLDKEEKRINLSLKHLTPDPWSVFESKYKVNDTVKGKVTKLADFGAFIEIEDGIEGLAHISELSWVKRISHPKEVLKIGDMVEAKILAYDLESGRVSLGLKQVKENPWDKISEKFPEGKIINALIKKVTPAGAFITLEEGIDGFLACEDLSWTKKIKNATSVLNEGEKIDVKVLEVDGQGKRIRLGVKQISEDPWSTLKKSYPRGSSVEGTITNKTEFGVFLKLPGGLEGLINKSNLVDSRDEDPVEFMKKLNIGDVLKVSVVEISDEKQKISLSLRDFVKNQQKEEISKYIHNQSENDGFTLGDLLKK